MPKIRFLNWYVNPEIPEDAVNDFIAIGEGENGVSKQKKLLVELLDKNQLYVNLSEIDDEEFGISAEDKELNEEFYGQDPDEGLELRDEFVAETPADHRRCGSRWKDYPCRESR